MKSNYKRLGDYIEPCDEKNTDNSELELRGISNQKFFQKAKTNTNGVDLSKYRIVRTGQFAFNRATTRNGDKISIAFSQEPDCIVSPSYRIFRSKDEDILNSEYLMMWFRRSEFDRFARFKSHGSAHEFFDYDEMCEVELPIPSIEKQRAIVKEYNTVVNRIKLNEELNQKLEETAQAIYKEWFVDFNFPITEESCPELASGSPHLIGKPYKSSGGEVVWNEELDKEVPKGWESRYLNQVMNIKHGFAYKGDYITLEESDNILLSPGNFKIGGGFKGDSFKYYTGEVPKDYIFNTGDIMVTMTDLSKAGDTLGYPALIPKIKKKNLLHNQRLGKVELIDNYNYKYFFYWLMRSNSYRNEIIGSATGTTVRHTSPTRIMNYMFTIPENITLLNKFENLIKNVQRKIEQHNDENQNLLDLKDLLLTKISKVELETETKI